MADRSPQVLDVQVGKNIKIARRQRGWSQIELARSIDVSSQQIQKYEAGANRIGAGRLTQIAEALQVPLHALIGSAKRVAEQPAGQTATNTLVARPDALRLLTAFHKIEARRVRHAALKLVEAVGRMRSERQLRPHRPGLRRRKSHWAHGVRRG
jgi:transcriptional regulator with XRE-family HTH domain